jgi:hypothetical protein
MAFPTSEMETDGSGWKMESGGEEKVGEGEGKGNEGCGNSQDAAVVCDRGY